MASLCSFPPIVDGFGVVSRSMVKGIIGLCVDGSIIRHLSEGKENNSYIVFGSLDSSLKFDVRIFIQT